MCCVYFKHEIHNYTWLTSSRDGVEDMNVIDLLQVERNLLITGIKMNEVVNGVGRIKKPEFENFTKEYARSLENMIIEWDEVILSKDGSMRNKK